MAPVLRFSHIDPIKDAEMALVMRFSHTVEMALDLVKLGSAILI